MALYDGSYQDVAKRLRDDDLVSLRLLRRAADMIERYGRALEEISNSQTDSAIIASDALKS